MLRYPFMRHNDATRYFNYDSFKDEFVAWPTNGSVNEEWISNTYGQMSLFKNLEVKHANGTFREMSEYMKIARIIEVNSFYFGRCYTITFNVNMTMDSYLQLEFKGGQVVEINTFPDEEGFFSNLDL